MSGFAGAELAIAMSKAGGLGLIGAGSDMMDNLNKAEQALGRYDELLPVGVGLILFAVEYDLVTRLLEQTKPAVIWLFATKQLEDYAIWSDKIRSATPKSQVWI